MERALKDRGSVKGVSGLGWAALIASAIFMGTIIAMLAGVIRQGQILPFSSVMIALYQLNFFFGAALFCWMAALLFLKEKREFFARTFGWIVLILAILSASMAINNLIGNLPLLTPAAQFDALAAQLPFILAAASMAAVIWRWDAPDKNAVNLVSMVCSIASLFLAVFFLSKSLGGVALAPLSLFNMLTSYAMVVLVSSIIWAATRSRRVFDMAVYAMNEEDARLVENVEERVQTAVAGMEAEIMDGMTRQEEEDGPDKAILDAEERFAGEDESEEEEAYEYEDEYEEEYEDEEDEEEANR